MPFMVAATHSGSSGLSMLMVLLPIVLVALMFFSQRRRSQAAARAQSELSVGDEIRTTSGLFGRLTQLDETVGHVEIAPGTVVRFDRRALLPVDGSAPAGSPASSARDSSAREGASAVSVATEQHVSDEVREPGTDGVDSTPLDGGKR